MTMEKRRYQRLAYEGTIFIELVSPSLEGNDSGEVAICQSVDISRSGLRVSINQELTVGAILQIGAELSDSEDTTLYLAGEVMWCERNHDEPGSWLVGFELLNANDSDIDTWRALLTKMDNQVY